MLATDANVLGAIVPLRDATPASASRKYEIQHTSYGYHEYSRHFNSTCKYSSADPVVTRNFLATIPTAASLSDVECSSLIICPHFYTNSSLLAASPPLETHSRVILIMHRTLRTRTRPQFPTLVDHIHAKTDKCSALCMVKPGKSAPRVAATNDCRV